MDMIMANQAALSLSIC